MANLEEIGSIKNEKGAEIFIFFRKSLISGRKKISFPGKQLYCQLILRVPVLLWKRSEQILIKSHSISSWHDVSEKKTTLASE